ncbi:MAG TPA: CheR family methyltransferase [Hyphomicrobium sp.]|nr:CheR family methyltransferase [Hyphomicrobium sp.]
MASQALVLDRREPDNRPQGDYLSKRNFARLARFINDYSGIRMPPTKITMLEGRLRRRLRVTGHESLESYCRFLFEQDGIDVEAVHLIDVATTNKTDFFREPNHFSYLVDEVLPELAEKGIGDIRVWSAACSTGAEPYTLAMILEDFRKSRRLGYSILATDLSTEVLATAIRGIYPEEMIDPVPRDMARKYVLRSVLGDRQVRIHHALRSKVGFGRLNLMDDRYEIGAPADVIFCRNVLIYFEKSVQAVVLARLCDCLAPGGYLFIGHSESVAGFSLPIKQVANTIFQKTR